MLSSCGHVMTAGISRLQASFICCFHVPQLSPLGTKHNHYYYFIHLKLFYTLLSGDQNRLYFTIFSVCLIMLHAGQFFIRARPHLPSTPPFSFLLTFPVARHHGQLVFQSSDSQSCTRITQRAGKTCRVHSATSESLIQAVWILVG